MAHKEAVMQEGDPPVPMKCFYQVRAMGRAVNALHHPGREYKNSLIPIPDLTRVLYLVYLRPERVTLPRKIPWVTLT